MNIDVKAPTKHGKYETQEGISANAMYNQYKKWFKEKFRGEKEPLSFTEWLNWAQDKGIVTKKYSIDAKDSIPAEQPVKKGEETKSKIGRNIAIGVGIGLLLVFAIAAVTKSTKD